MAAEEAKHLMSHYDKVHGFSSDIEKDMEVAISRGHFENVELYDKDQNVLYISSHVDYVFLEKFADEHDHSALFKEEAQYTRKEINGGQYLFAVAPIRDDAGDIQGYFEGILHIDDLIIASIYNQIAYSIVIVVVALAMASLVFYPIILRLNGRVIRHSEILLSSNLKMLEILGTATEKRDYDTNDHNIRVTLLASRLAEAFGVAKHQMPGIIKGSMLHDVGKIGIPDHILLKEGPLDSGEMSIMREHVTHGVHIIENHRWLSDALDIIQYHHEWYNGSGYMKGLGGEDIPIGARLFAIVDVFDALMVKRPYKQPIPFDKTMTIMESKKGTHFDPKVFKAFTDNAKHFYSELYDREADVLDWKMKSLIEKHFRTTTYGDVMDMPLEAP